MLCEWGLEKKAFTITLDNASANDKMVKCLKDDLHAIPPLPCNEKWLCDAHKDPCESISSMAGPMLELYEKYWSDHSTILSFAILLDHRYKIQLLKKLYSVLYVEDEVERRISLVYTEFVNLYVYYLKTVLCSFSNSSVQSNSTQSSSVSSSSWPRTFKKSNLFQNFDANLAASRSGKSDVDSYMNLPLLPRIEDTQFDVLDYWKSQTHGGRILNKLRAKLLPKNVEIFVTTRNWLYGFESEEKDENYLSVVKDSPITDLAEE
ncbi:hypothetical protein V6N13_123149 [Hibiscus sabdariffa]